MKLTRRDFLQFALRSAGVVVGAYVLESCGGGGGSGGSPGPPNPNHLVAKRNDSVLHITEDYFTVQTVYDPDLDDDKVVKLLWHDQTILAGEWLVFEINNGGELIGSGVSAAHTQVAKDDIVTWKSLT